MSMSRSASMLSFLALVLVASATHLITVSAAQNLCNMTQGDLSACRPAIAMVKPVSTPSDVCCTALKKADFACLCAYKNSGWLRFLSIDPNLAMQLPAKCNMATSVQC